MSLRDRLVRIVTFTAAVSCCGMLTATVVEAQAPSGNGQTVSLKLIDADLRTAINMLIQQSGASIVYEPSDKAFSPVAVILHEVPVDKALEHIARSAGAQVVKLDDGTYIVGPKQAVVASVQTTQTNMVQSVPVRHRTEKIRVQYSRPSDLLGAMGVVGRAGDTSTRNNDTFMRMLQGVNQQVISKPEALISVPNPFMNNDEDSANMSETPDSGLNQFGGSNRGGNQGGMGTRGGNQGGMGGSTGGRGGMSGGINQAGGGATGGMGGMMGGGTTGMGGVGGGQISFPGLEGVGEEIAALDIDNSLVVTGDEDFINSVRKRIRLLDVPQQQVEVKAEFVTISLSETKRLGIDWLVQQVNTQAGTTPGTFANSAAPVFIKYATGNLVTELRAMLTNSKGRVSQAPIITTLNNVPAQVGTQTEYPVWVAQVQSGNTGPNVTTYDIQNYTTDTSMTVQPTILGDGRILINLPLQVEDVPEFKKGPDGTEAPVTTRQYVEATRIVNSGETVVIGGFVRRSDSRSTGKIPLLSDLPWIGSLFRSQSNETADNELLIFLTARILEDSNGPLASSVTP